MFEYLGSLLPRFKLHSTEVPQQSWDQLRVVHLLTLVMMIGHRTLIDQCYLRHLRQDNVTLIILIIVEQ